MSAMKNFNASLNALLQQTVNETLDKLLKLVQEGEDNDDEIDLAEMIASLKESVKKQFPTTGGKVKKVKDANAPKGASTAYLLYSNAVRDKVRKANPDLKLGEVAKVIGKQWAELTDAEKKPYNEQAEKDKIRYKKEMDAYKAKKGGDKSSDEE